MKGNAPLHTISRFLRRVVNIIIIMLEIITFILALVFLLDGQVASAIGFMFAFYFVDFTRDRIIPAIRKNIDDRLHVTTPKESEK